MPLRFLINRLIYDQQETILVVDGMEVRGTAEALAATLSDVVMDAWTIEISVVDDGALKIFATVEEEHE